MKRKSTKPWIILIAAPFAALLVTMLAQLIVRFALSGTDSQLGDIMVSLINIISLLIGIVSVVAMIGLPVWIVMLVIALDHNSKLKAPRPKRK